MCRMFSIFTNWFRSPGTNSGEMASLKKQEEESIIKEMNKMFYFVKPTCQSKPGVISEAHVNIGGLVLNCCDEVHPNIFIGDWYCAKNKPYLKQLGITHVVNTAEGKLLGMVDTDSDYYRYSGIKYMGLHLMDLPVSDISNYFFEVSDFIHNAVTSGGRVLVHCVMGVSRSSTCVIAYLMIKEGMTATEALRKVRLSRPVRPNNGFVQQLAELDIKLKRSRIGNGFTVIERKHRIGRQSLYLPTGRFMSFQPASQLYKIRKFL